MWTQPSASKTASASFGTPRYPSIALGPAHHSSPGWLTSPDAGTATSVPVSGSTTRNRTFGTAGPIVPRSMSRRSSGMTWVTGDSSVMP